MLPLPLPLEQERGTLSLPLSHELERERGLSLGLSLEFEAAHMAPKPRAVRAVNSLAAAAQSDLLLEPAPIKF